MLLSSRGLAPGLVRLHGSNAVQACSRSLAQGRLNTRLLGSNSPPFSTAGNNSSGLAARPGAMSPQHEAASQEAAQAPDKRGPAEAGRQLLSVAPMMDWTDIHYRQLARLISKHTWLYTEMVVDQTLMFNPNTDKFLWFPPEQRPIVCQLGGSNPETLAKAAKMVEQYGYDEINLNCGCPSDRVAGAGCFGAALMLQPERVAACTAAMQAAVSIPVTVKCRIGVDSVDTYESLCEFIRVVARDGGVRHFVIHARKCILKGLSPAQNRTVPPLKREWVFALKRDFPELDFSLNGVVGSCHEAAAAIAHSGGVAQTHGVMIGRAAYSYPWATLSDADRAVFGAIKNASLSRRQVLEEYAKYGDSILGKWGIKPDGSKAPNVKAVIKPLLGMFHGERGCKKWKQAIDAVLKKATPDLTVSQVLEATLPCVPEDVLNAPPTALPLPEFTLDPLPRRPDGFVPLSATPTVALRDGQERQAEPSTAEGHSNVESVRPEDSGACGPYILEGQIESEIPGSTASASSGVEAGGLEGMREEAAGARSQECIERIEEAIGACDLASPGELGQGAECRQPLHTEFDSRADRAVASVV